MPKLNKDAMEAAVVKVTPALATRDVIEELCCLWFDGTKVRAFNGTIGLETDMPCNIEGGLRGKLMGDLLTNLHVKEVELVATAESVRLSGGHTKADLALLPADREVPWPDLPASGGLKLTKDFLTCLKACMLSIGPDASSPDQLGITVQKSGARDLNFYSTDRRTISWMTCTAPKGWPADRITLPTAFCEQLLKLFKANDDFNLSDGTAVASNEATKLVGQLVIIERPLNFAKTIAALLPEDFEAKAFPVPEKLAACLERAKALMVGSGEEQASFETDGLGALVLSASSGLGKMTDTMAVEAEVAALNVRFDPKLISRALDEADNMLLTEDATIMLNDDGLVYLISNRS